MNTIPFALLQSQYIYELAQPANLMNLYRLWWLERKMSRFMSSK